MKALRIYPSAIILGGSGGLVGFYLGFSRGAAVMLGVAAVCLWLGLEGVVKKARARNEARELPR
jgi:hypothetical protein